MPPEDPTLAPPSSRARSETELVALRGSVASLENDLAILRQTLAMRQSNTESTYRAVFDSVNDSIFILDLDTGALVDANRTELSMCGYSRDELLGQPLTMLGADPASPLLAFGGAAWQRAAAGEAQRLEWACRRKDGQLFSAEVSLKRVRLTGHDRMLAIVMDISERKEREARERLIELQAATLTELSTPLMPISNHVLVMPLIGTIDPRRAHQVLETLLSGIAQNSAKVAILDVTGVSVVDTAFAEALLRMARAVKLLGARLMLTGIRPEVAQTLVRLSASLADIATHSTLQAGIAAARA